MLSLLSIPFSGLDNVSYTLKKYILSEVRNIFEKYNAMPAEKKQVETYG